MSLDNYNLFPDEKIKKVRGNKRDVMVHAAVTIMNRQKKIQVIGEKENEICQFAAELDADLLPMTEAQAKAMFEKISRACFDKMVLHGLIRY